MISHKHRCIFIHVPKCAGTTIEDMIWPGPRTVEDLWMGNVSKYYNPYQTGGMQHLFAMHVRHSVGPSVFYKYFKFAFVRNPWDKAISQYHYMREREDLREFIGMSLNDPFKKYIELIKIKVHVQWDNQYKYVYSDDGEIMVDFIGRFERFSSDIRKILNILDIHLDEVPHAKKSDHKPYAEYYDAESIEMVHGLYKSDILAFGYTFDGNEFSGAGVD